MSTPRVECAFFISPPWDDLLFGRSGKLFRRWELFGGLGRWELFFGDRCLVNVWSMGAVVSMGDVWSVGAVWSSFLVDESCLPRMFDFLFGLWELFCRHPQVSILTARTQISSFTGVLDALLL